MARVTKKDIYYLEDRINTILERHGYKCRVSVQWAYGQPRVYLYVGDQQEAEMSPRLPTSGIYRWLWAYHMGLCMGLNKDNA